MRIVPRLSIVIPCPACDQSFEDTLVSVLQNRPEDCEVVVVCRGDYSDPYGLRGEVRFLEMPADTSLVELVNAGVVQSRGEIVHVLQCGIEVAEGWTEAPLRRMEDPSLGSVSPLLVSTSGAVSRATAGISYDSAGRRRLRRVSAVGELGSVAELTILGPSFNAGFYRREALHRIGGLDPAVGTRLADVDLALALRSAGYGTACETGSRVTGPALDQDRVLGWRESAQAEYLFWKHAGRRGWIRSLCGHTLLIASELLQSIVHPWRLIGLLGRLQACLLPPARSSLIPAAQGHPKPPPHFLSKNASRRRRARSTRRDVA
jgi:hypothetical protein